MGVLFAWDSVSVGMCVRSHVLTRVRGCAHALRRADWRTAYHTPMIPRCAHGNERMQRWLDDWLEAPTSFSASADNINTSWRQRWGKSLQLLFDGTIFCSCSSFSHWNVDVYVLNLQTFCLRFEKRCACFGVVYKNEEFDFLSVLSDYAFLGLCLCSKDFHLLPASTTLTTVRSTWHVFVGKSLLRKVKR